MIWILGAIIVLLIIEIGNTAYQNPCCIGLHDYKYLIPMNNSERDSEGTVTWWKLRACGRCKKAHVIAEGHHTFRGSTMRKMPIAFEDAEEMFAKQPMVHRTMLAIAVAKQASKKAGM